MHKACSVLETFTQIYLVLAGTWLGSGRGRAWGWGGGGEDSLRVWLSSSTGPSFPGKLWALNGSERGDLGRGCSSLWPRGTTGGRACH